MIDERWTMLQERLLRQPEDAATWLATAAYADHLGCLPGGLPGDALEILTTLWAARPGRRVLGALVLPMLRLAPADELDTDLGPHWSTHAASSNGGEAYDRTTGFPVQVRRRFDGGRMRLVPGDALGPACFVDVAAATPDRVQRLAATLAVSLDDDAALAGAARALGCRLSQPAEWPRLEAVLGAAASPALRLVRDLPAPRPERLAAGPQDSLFVDALLRRFHRG